MMFLNPTVSLCMIVKDEEDNLPRALASVSDVVDEMIVVDTGSHDRTIETAKKYGAHTFRISWKIDLSAARNFALRHASGDWILVLDADQELDPKSKSKLKTCLIDSSAEAFYFSRNHYTDAGEVFADRALALFRRRPYYRFQGVWGETVTPLSEQEQTVAEAGDIVIHHYGHLYRERMAKNKLQRNAEIIQQYRQANPDDANGLYWLGAQLFLERWYKEACGPLEQAVSSLDVQSAHFSHALYLLAQCYLMLQQTEKCSHLLEKGIRLFLDYSDLHYLQGICRMCEEQWEAALSSFVRCSSLPRPPLRYVSQEGIHATPCYHFAAICYQRLTGLKS